MEYTLRYFSRVEVQSEDIDKAAGNIHDAVRFALEEEGPSDDWDEMSFGEVLRIQKGAE
ncbi:hypothetical protein N9Y00_07985 [Tateyamaria sp.]|nr:hypothetical protein [Tateyamaria sp.]